MNNNFIQNFLEVADKVDKLGKTITWDIPNGADKQRYDQYLTKILPLLSENGLIVVDNVGNYAEHMKPFLDKCKNDKGLIAHFLNIDFGLLMILKNNGTNLYA